MVRCPLTKALSIQHEPHANSTEPHGPNASATESMWTPCKCHRATWTPCKFPQSPRGPHETSHRASSTELRGPQASPTESHGFHASSHRTTQTPCKFLQSHMDSMQVPQSSRGPHVSPTEQVLQIYMDPRQVPTEPAWSWH